MTATPACAESTENIEGVQSAGAIDGLEVTYLGNAGFLISSGEHQVLIDGLYRGDTGGYAVIPPETLQKLEQAEAPYDTIDLVLATHHHPDHFDAQSVARHLQNNPEARFISTPQAVERLRDAVDDFSTLASRVQAELPAEGLQSLVELPGIKIHAMNLHHGRGAATPVENLGFLVELDGKKFLHVGDTEVSYGELYVHKLGRRKIDVLFVGFWELQRTARWRIFHDVKAGRTVAMHIPRSDAAPNYFGGATSLDEVLNKIQTVAPGTVVFSHALETKILGPLQEANEPG
jgi:L-ascorbate metabolism protein UlaG (beta-lactamase superfamily)